MIEITSFQVEFQVEFLIPVTHCTSEDSLYIKFNKKILSFTCIG